MATFDPRSLSYTEEEQKLGSKINLYGSKTQTLGQQYAGMSQAERQAAKKAKLRQNKLYKIAEIGDNSGQPAGTAYTPEDTKPKFGGFTEEEQFNMDNFRVPANYIDFLTHQETLDVTGQNKFGGRTSSPFETEFGEMKIPEGFNFQEFRMFAENTKDTGFWEDYRNLDVSVQNLYGGNAPTFGGISQEVDPRYQSYTPNELEAMGIDAAMDNIIETGGIPTYHKWAKDESGQWQPRPAEAVFDELYRMNGIDPNDPQAVEFFWSLADDDMLYAAEFFDVIEWPSGGGGGYGGYGGMPTPSRQYGRGRQPQSTRGNYASYLSLTSWSI